MGKHTLYCVPVLVSALLVVEMKSERVLDQKQKPVMDVTGSCPNFLDATRQNVDSSRSRLGAYRRAYLMAGGSPCQAFLHT
jgi:hypothetical protein